MYAKHFIEYPVLNAVSIVFANTNCQFRPSFHPPLYVFSLPHIFYLRPKLAILFAQFLHIMEVCLMHGSKYRELKDDFSIIRIFTILLHYILPQKSKTFTFDSQILGRKFLSTQNCMSFDNKFHPKKSGNPRQFHSNRILLCIEIKPKDLEKSY